MIALGLWVSSCSSPKPVAKPGPTAASPPPVSSVRATEPVITVRSDDKRSAFVVNARESKVEVGSAGPESGELKNIDGRIEKDGTVLSKFWAPRASIDKVKGTLVMDGRVTVTDTARGLTLKADSVVFNQEEGRIVAKGSVTVTSEGMAMGPLPELWTTPDLKKIATPGKFK